MSQFAMKKIKIIALSLLLIFSFSAIDAQAGGGLRGILKAAKEITENILEGSIRALTNPKEFLALAKMGRIDAGLQTSPVKMEGTVMEVLIMNDRHTAGEVPASAAAGMLKIGITNETYTSDINFILNLFY